MPPVISVAGFSNAGKTRVACSLVKSLTASGYRVAAIKHCHAGYSMDRPNSDTDRLNQAGADLVIAVGPGGLSQLERRSEEPSLAEVVSNLSENYDIVVAEGFKYGSGPKILVVGQSGAPPAVDGVVAVVSEDHHYTAPVPTYNFDQLGELAEQIRDELLVINPEDTAEPSVTLRVNGVDVPLRSYPAGALRGILQGFLTSLKGVPENPNEVQITLTLDGS